MAGGNEAAIEALVSAIERDIRVTRAGELVNTAVQYQHVAELQLIKNAYQKMIAQAPASNSIEAPAQGFPLRTALDKIKKTYIDDPDRSTITAIGGSHPYYNLVRNTIQVYIKDILTPLYLREESFYRLRLEVESKLERLPYNNEDEISLSITALEQILEGQPIQPPAEGRLHAMLDLIKSLHDDDDEDEEIAKTYGSLENHQAIIRVAIQKRIDELKRLSAEEKARLIHTTQTQAKKLDESRGLMAAHVPPRPGERSHVETGNPNSELYQALLVLAVAGSQPRTHSTENIDNAIRLRFLMLQGVYLLVLGLAYLAIFFATTLCMGWLGGTILHAAGWNGMISGGALVNFSRKLAGAMYLIDVLYTTVVKIVYAKNPAKLKKFLHLNQHYLVGSAIRIGIEGIVAIPITLALLGYGYTSMTAAFAGAAGVIGYTILPFILIPASFIVFVSLNNLFITVAKSLVRQHAVAAPRPEPAAPQIQPPEAALEQSAQHAAAPAVAAVAASADNAGTVSPSSTSISSSEPDYQLPTREERAEKLERMLAARKEASTRSAPATESTSFSSYASSSGSSASSSSSSASVSAQSLARTVELEDLQAIREKRIARLGTPAGASSISKI